MNKLSTVLKNEYLAKELIFTLTPNEFVAKFDVSKNAINLYKFRKNKANNTIKPESINLATNELVKLGPGAKAWITRKANNPDKWLKKEQEPKVLGMPAILAKIRTEKSPEVHTIVKDNKDLNLTVNGVKVTIQAKLLTNVLISETSIQINF